MVVVGGGGWWVVGTHGNPTHGNSTKQKLTKWQNMITFCRFRHPAVYEPAHMMWATFWHGASILRQVYTFIFPMLVAPNHFSLVTHMCLFVIILLWYIDIFIYVYISSLLNHVGISQWVLFIIDQCLYTQRKVSSLWQHRKAKSKFHATRHYGW